MNIILPSYQFESPESAGSLPKHIENAGRTCYKSEPKKGDTTEKFIGRIMGRNHASVLEHGKYTVELPRAQAHALAALNPKFLHITNTKKRTLVTGNIRVLREMTMAGVHNLYPIIGFLAQKEPVLFKGIPNLDKMVDMYNQNQVGNYTLMQDDDLDEQEKYHHIYRTIRFICDRGISHEMVRHRLASFSQMSTRFCNFSDNKYNSSLTFIKPHWVSNDLLGEFTNDESINKIMDNSNIPPKHRIWFSSCLQAEQSYLLLLQEDEDEKGWIPGQARSVLPNSLMTEIVMTTSLAHWSIIIGLRTHASAHTQYREVMNPVADDFRREFPFMANVCPDPVAPIKFYDDLLMEKAAELTKQPN